MNAADLLLSKYKDSVRHFDLHYEFCIISNSQAKNGGILIVGMNPSGDSGPEIADYFYNCRKKSEGGWGDKGCFWGPKHDMMGKYDRYAQYIDLLPIRLTPQKDVDTIDSNYRARLLEVTQQHIEEIGPKLIILANSSAIYYWGSNKDSVWMGYQLEHIHLLKNKWELYRIKGLRDKESDLINREFFTKHKFISNLEDSYLLRYCQVSKRHKQPKPDEIITETDIELLLKEIDPVWESTLY